MGRRVLYITANTPWGRGETFTLMTLLELKRRNVDLLITPRNPPREVFHKESSEILQSACWLPVIDLRMIAFCSVALLTRRSVLRALAGVIRHSRTPLILAKNLAVVPKATWVERMLREHDVGHIHAEWGSTTSTMAYVVSRTSGIPWSFTLHRWDIDEDNMLGEKVRSAQFVRCISKRGREELLRITGGAGENKVHVMYLGVAMPERPAESTAVSKSPVIAVPANLVEKKGHEYLIEALSLVTKRCPGRFECRFYGDGPLRSALERRVRESGLTGYIAMPGMMPHERLMGMYAMGKADIVVLPSVNASNGEREGIPVALMEAMSYGIPVVSTSTGAIPELLSNGAGLMVDEKNADQLADAIARLLTDPDLRQRIGTEGRRRVSLEFDISANTARLVRLMRSDSGYSSDCCRVHVPEQRQEGSGVARR